MEKTEDPISITESVITAFKLRHSEPLGFLENRYRYHRESADTLLKNTKDSKKRVKEGTFDLYLCHRDFEEKFAKAIDCLKKE